MATRDIISFFGLGQFSGSSQVASVTDGQNPDNQRNYLKLLSVIITAIAQTLGDIGVTRDYTACCDVTNTVKIVTKSRQITKSHAESRQVTKSSVKSREVT